MSEYILTQLNDRVMTIRLNRPDKKNALTEDMYAELAGILKSAAVDNDVRVVVFTGGNDAYSSGNDMQDFLRNPPKDDQAPVGQFMRELAAFPKPVVVAANGIAVGIGVTMLLHSDVVYLGQSARLQLPFINIGLCPEFASSYLLPRLIGNVRAAELIMFGELFSAAKALEYGLVNAVLPDAEVEAYALERARKLSRLPPHALRVTKKLLRRWSEDAVEMGIKSEFEQFIPMLTMPEAQEAVSAFMQKRKPDFSKFT